MALSHKIEYIASDSRRQDIPWVRATDAAGRQSIYRSDDKTSQDPPPPGDIRQVDCMDCHNRPTHVIQPPDRAVNISLETGRLDRALPFLKKYAVEALTVPYPDGPAADRGIASYIRGAYQRLDPQLAENRKSNINQAIDELRTIYRRNFYPSMKIDWRTYPDNIGHMIYDGCFRCHDGKHISNDKGAIRRECNVCHEFMEPMTGPAGQNAFQQMTPEHPYKLPGIHNQLNCSACHSGGRAPVASCEGCHTTQSQFREGKSPMLPGLKVTPPVVMADLSCDSCHDLSKPASVPASAQCETCHDKGYGDMVQMWKSDAKASRDKAGAAIEEFRKRVGSGRARNAQEESLRQLLDQMQTAFAQVQKAGAHHNTDLAEAVYQQIVKLSSEGQNPAAK